MADALCGPSNALQNFQKHSSVDRTLQQDRLTSRQSPAQGFRSSPGTDSGLLDPDFEAFQAGHAGPPQPDFHHLPPQFSHAPPPPPPPQFAQAPRDPDWAADFQRLNLSSQPPPIQQYGPPQVANAPPSWHQDFMRQQSPAVQAPSYQQNSYGGMSSFGMGAYAGSAFQQRPHFGGVNSVPASDVAQGKQRVQDAVPEFDEAAFEMAFAQAQQDMLEETSSHQQAEAPDLQREQEQLRLEEDPLLARLQEARPAVYAAVKLRTELDAGQIAIAETYLSDLQVLESSGQITADISEARWINDTLQEVVGRSASEGFRTKTERLVKAINERLMSTYPLLSRLPINQDKIWEELEAAGYNRALLPEHAGQQSQQKEEQSPRNDDDEMAETAGRLLERVADNTSEKFQNSQFLELMRRLRDREVRVEGDRMVEVGAQSSASPSGPTATTVPGVDPKILDHAAVDFDMPIYSEDGSEGTIIFVPPTMLPGPPPQMPAFRSMSRMGILEEMGPRA